MPSDESLTALMAEALMEEMGVGQGSAGYIGLHVRAGDSCVKWQQDFGGDWWVCHDDDDDDARLRGRLVGMMMMMMMTGGYAILPTG